MNRREWMFTAMGAVLAGCGRADEPETVVPLSTAANPERGFYTQHAVEDANDFAAARASGTTLVLLTMNLRDFRDKPLNDAKLDLLDSALKAVRQAGLKVIFRAAYGFTDADYRVDPLDLGLIRGHILKMGAVLCKHAPVVWAVQAGMLGPWGEWHGSNHGNPPSLEARQTVADAWLKSMPPLAFLQIRRPMFLRDMFPSKNDPALARTGFHNDALLALPDDMGTYSEAGWDRDREVRWCGNQEKRTPFGGETVPDSEGTTGEQVISELRSLRITYLNRGYHGGTLARWKQMRVGQQTVYNQVEARMGHRWVRNRVNISRDGKMVAFELENTGFAPIYTSRKVEAVWLHQTTKEAMMSPVVANVDLRGLLPESGVLPVKLVLPKQPAGSLLGIRLPDPANELRDDGRYALRLMNEGNRFEQETGWNYSL